MYSVLLLHGLGWGQEDLPTFKSNLNEFPNYSHIFCYNHNCENGNLQVYTENLL